jgi:hypothetical protein
MNVPELSFTVDGKTYALTPPTPRIAFKVSRTMGGVAAALHRCQAGDLDAYVALLKVACPDAPKTEAALEAFVFENIEFINFPLSRYAQSLQFGGKVPTLFSEPAADDAEDAEGNGEPAAEADAASL